MAIISEELTKARREEIVSACAELYDVMSYKEITLGKISARTSFTRTSIYNYFDTREEIFLALLEREYRCWIEDQKRICENMSMTVDEFAEAFSSALSRRGRMLKLVSMNLYDLEAGSREENLTSFKRAYGEALQATRDCLARFFPSLTADEHTRFLYAVYPFMFGVYPYTAVTEKQKRAMESAGVKYETYSVREITRSLVSALLNGFLNK